MTPEEYAAQVKTENELFFALLETCTNSPKTTEAVLSFIRLAYSTGRRDESRALAEELRLSIR